MLYRSCLFFAFLGAIAFAADSERGIAASGKTNSPNLMENSGFELFQERTLQPTAWVVSLPDGVTAGADLSVAHSGKAALRLDVADVVPVGWRSIYQNVSVLKSGDNYTLSGWVRTQNVRDGAGAYISISCYASSGQRLSFSDSPLKLNGTQDWKYLSSTLTTPEGTSQIRIFLIVHGRGSAWFDEVQLEQGTAPTPYRLSDRDDKRGTLSVPGRVLLMDRGKFSPATAFDGCTVSLLDEPVASSNVRVLVKYGPLPKETPLKVDLNWFDLLGADRGVLVKSETRMVSGDDQTIFDIPLPDNGELQVITISAILGEKIFKSRKIKVHYAGDEINPTYNPAWGLSGDTWSWNTAGAQVKAEGDLVWTPKPYRFEKGKSIRYIDFEQGNDGNSGQTTAQAWRHHPWDGMASGNAKNERSADTFVFKRGVIYRGTLVAARSGTDGKQVQLCSDPAWGGGEASFFGSERITGKWKRLADGELPTVKNIKNIWTTTLGTEYIPRSLWEIRDGKIIRINLARTPNWKWTDPYDIRSGWGAWQDVKPQGEPKRLLCSDEKLAFFAPGSLKGALVYWDFPGVIGTPMPALVLDNTGDTLDFKLGWSTADWSKGSRDLIGCKYFIEDAPVLLDEPGEYWFDAHSGRMYARLADDRDPNTCIVEAACRANAIVLADCKNVSVSGLRFACANAGDPLISYSADRYRRPGSILVTGSCDNIRVAQCRFEQVVAAFYSEITYPGAVQDRIAVEDNDIIDTEMYGIHIDDAQDFNTSEFDTPTPLVRVRVLRNRIRRAGLGFRPVETGNRPAITIRYPILCEVAGNIIEDSGGSGIIVLGGKSGTYTYDFREVPFTRNLIHHNKVINSMQTYCDYGGIASWQAGPCYVYNNISGNAIGHMRLWAGFYNKPKSYTSQYFAFAYYLDGGFKNYLFNNIAWGIGNDVSGLNLSNDGPVANAGGMFNIVGFNNAVFNNTFYRFGSGLRHQYSVREGSGSLS